MRTATLSPKNAARSGIFDESWYLTNGLRCEMKTVRPSGVQHRIMTQVPSIVVAKFVRNSQYDTSAAPLQNLGWPSINDLIRKETASLKLSPPSASFAAPPTSEVNTTLQVTSEGFFSPPTRPEFTRDLANLQNIHSRRC